MPLRFCSEPRCPEPAAYRGRCRTHSRGRERETHPNKSIYGSRRWQLTRRRYLSEHPLCECGCGHISEDVHHKQDIQAGGDPWAWDNLEALTHACHARVTRATQTGTTG